MTETRPNQPFADRLLEQETRVSEAQLNEYRVKLHTNLARAVRQERRMRVVTFGMTAVALFGFWYFLMAALLGPPGAHPIERVFKLFPDPVGMIVGIALWACYLACAICSIPFLLTYFLQYRRKLEQTKQDQILDILGELQRQISELQRRDPPATK